MVLSSATSLTSKDTVKVLWPPGRSRPVSSLTRTRAEVITVATSRSKPSRVVQSSSNVVVKGWFSSCAQRTRTQRAAWRGSVRFWAFGQSAR